MHEKHRLRLPVVGLVKSSELIISENNCGGENELDFCFSVQKRAC